MNLKKKTVHTLGSSKKSGNKSRSLSSIENQCTTLRVGKGTLELLEKDYPELLKNKIYNEISK